MTSGEPHLRLFVAATIPDEILTSLAAAIAPHRDVVSGARWAPLQNQHVTLKFLGRVPESLRPAIDEACSAAAAASSPGSLSVSGLGAFPSARRARVLWAGIDDPASVLSTLAKALDVRLAGLGFEAEKRAFTPHLTLARLRNPAPVSQIVQAVGFRSRSFTLARFELFRSHLSPKGARYEVLDRYVLGGG